MLKILYEWITKPYIKWNFIDSIVCYIEILDDIINDTRFEMNKIRYDRSNYGKRTNRNIQK